MRLTNIERKFDTYFISIANGSTYEISLDEKNMYAKGLSKKVLKHPITSRGEIINYFTSCAVHKNPVPKDLKIFFERIISLPCSLKTKEFFLRGLCGHIYNYHRLDLDWKTIFKCIQLFENNDVVCEKVSCRYDFSRYCHELLEMKRFYSSFNKEDIDFFENFLFGREYDTIKIDDITSCKVLRQELKAVSKLVKKRNDFLETAFGDIPKTILEKNYGIRITSEETWLKNTYNEILRNYNKVKFLLKHTHLDNYKLTNLKRDREFLEVYWEKERTRIENETFLKNQSSKNLFFENEQYKIYIPYTREELGIIGNAFRNCANDFEWNNYLADGKRFLCVVVDKDNNDFEVCLDIDSTSLLIKQYLGCANTPVSDRSLLNFKGAYQTYLNTLK